jgi:hypothetical protein
MKKTLFMLFCLLCSIGAMAQKKTITGVVTDATGDMNIEDHRLKRSDDLLE